MSLVSVVVPTYAHERFVLESLASVFAQDHRPLEVIVVDDGSPDGTAALLAPLAADGRIRLVHQANAGQAAARNAGAALARGEYLTFLDDDDLLLPGSIAWRVAALSREPGASMVYGAPLVFAGTVPDTPGERDVSERRVHRTTFQVWNRIWSPGQVLLRRADFEAVGGFDPSLWGTDDWDLWLRLLERGPARASSRPALAYRLHEANASRDVARMYESSLRVARRHLARSPAEVRPVIRKFTFMRLRRWHVPRIEGMARAAVAEGAWRRVAAAGRAWAIAWAADAFAQLALKAYLVRRGRWRLPAELVPAQVYDEPA